MKICVFIVLVEETCGTIKCGPKMKCLIDTATHRARCVSCRYKCDRRRNMVRILIVV